MISRRARAKLIAPTAGTLAMLSVFAAVIWSKLRLVGNVPRTAYAEPERSGGQPEVTNRYAAEGTEARPAEDSRDESAAEAIVVVPECDE